MTMHRYSCLILAVTAVVLFIASPAPAQKPRGRDAPVEPYKPVPVTLPAAPGDAGFQTFRQELAAVAKSRVYARLASLVEAQGFFWDRDFGGFDRRKAAVDNLAAALRLEHRDGAGWDALASFAAEATAAPLDSRPGIICAPGPPRFDGVDLDRLFDVTRTDGLDWAYPRAGDTPARAAPRPNAAVIEVLGLHFVRLLGFDGPDSDAPGRTQWARVATPGGKIGFVAPNTLLSRTSERLCFGKDPLGRWGIAGYVGGGD